MATLYTGEQFWTDRNWVVTATSKKGRYSSRKEFIDAVNKWMDEHDMTYRWAGEHTHEHNGRITYGYDVKITSGGEHRTFFALKWS